MEEGGGHSSEDVVGKYKRLLSMARSSLETNQKSLAEKDSIIEGLQAMVERLERDKSLAMNGRDNYKLHDEVSMPRNLSRRVDVNGIIWILVEYDHHHSDSWRSFSTEQDLDDFIRRLPGGTLTKPQRCYSVTESAQIESEAKTKIDKVVDEFRRYKVKMEIARKQSSVDTKHRQAVIEDSGIVVDEEHNSVDQYLKYKEENSRLQSQLSSIEAKWKLAYEKLVRENESLRLSGGEALLAAQWRERYETTSKEKYDLQEKLKVFERGKSSEVGGKSIEEAYNELKDDHRELQRRMNAIDKRRIHESHSLNDLSSASNSMDSSKLEYVKQMVFQYLVCKDSEVKQHLETALEAMFRFSDKEKASIEARRKESSQDTIAAISNFLMSPSTKTSR